MARPDANGNIVCTRCNRSLPGTIEYYHRHRDAFKPKCKECRGTSFGVHDYNRVMAVPEGKKICAGCERILPADVEHFYHTEKTSDGYTSRCKECRGDGYDFGLHRPNRSLDIPDGEWFCKSCEQVLPLNGRYFYQKDSALSDSGFEHLCKACSAQRRNQQRRAGRANVEDGLSGRQWGFVKSLWLDGGTVQCAYCGTPTAEPERDHVQPLTDGGGTVPENIVPACSSCNRSKNDTLVTDWYPKSDVFDPERWEQIQEHLRGDTHIPE